MGRCTPTIWYRFRRWLVRKLVPPNMTVFCFDGMENIGGSNLYDPVLEIPESGTLVFHCQKIPQSANVQNHQNSDM